MERYRQIIFFKDYFFDFFEQQTEKVKEKIDHVLFVVTVAKRIPQKFFQHVEGTNGLYEIRVEFQGNIYRIFCCFDEGQVVILFKGSFLKLNGNETFRLGRAAHLKKAGCTPSAGQQPWNLLLLALTSDPQSLIVGT